jgi:hypothetical protein
MRNLVWLFLMLGLLLPEAARASIIQNSVRSESETASAPIGSPGGDASAPAGGPNAPALLNMPITQYHFHGLSFSSYMDASYNYLVRSNHFTSGIHDRLFDIKPNGLTLQQVAFTLAKEPARGFGGLLNIIAGRDADTLSSVGAKPNYFGIQNFGVDLTQVYLQYALSKFTLIVGKFNALAGIEDNCPIENANFSHSLINQFAEPGTLLGFRGMYALSSNLNIAVGLNNGWDIIDDTGRQKTLEIAIIYQLTPHFALAAQAYSGEQPVTENTSVSPTGKRNAIDIFGTWQLTPQLSVAFNYDYVTQNKATLPFNVLSNAVWTGFTGYLTYQFTDRWRTTLRGELFADSNGYQTGVRQSLKEGTLTLAYSPTQALDLRAETRHDLSNVASFLNKNGVGANRNQQSFALEGIYKF